ncbi:MAG TPA: proline dehydrogenase family protein [Solirubrobacterales bacterium]
MREATSPDEAAVRRIGERLLEAMPPRARGPLGRAEERLMSRLAEEPETKAALFRLVDVAPMCRNAADLAAHLAALVGEVDDPPGTVGLAAGLGRSRVAAPFVGAVAERAVHAMAGRFIVGTDVDDAAGELRRLWRKGVAATVDLLGEATVTEAEADRYAQRCLDGLDSLAAQAKSWPADAVSLEDRHGPIPRVNLSVKVSALTPEIREEDPRRGADDARPRLRLLLERARALGAHLHVDMESLESRETVTALVREALAEPEFRDGPSAGVVLQAYLRDSPEQLEAWLEWAERVGRDPPLVIRLVKGAYWDHEVVEAAQAGWEAPVFTERAACDRNFEALTRRLLARADLVRPAIASHNVRSVAHAIAAAEAAGAADVLELQVLRGLGDDLQDALAGVGYRVRAYCPVGDLIAGMAYLVRRLLENTSNDSFLRLRATADDPEALLAPP